MGRPLAHPRPTARSAHFHNTEGSRAVPYAPAPGRVPDPAAMELDVLAALLKHRAAEAQREERHARKR